MSEATVPFPKKEPPARRRRVELEFLPAALKVLDTPASPTARWTAAALAAFFSVGIAWSVFGHVDIIASAPGTVIPAGQSKVVQPLDPGIVREILVKDGDHVAAGQRLIVLNATVATADRERLAGNLRQARLDVAGMSALRAGIEGGDWRTAFVAPEGVPPREAEIERAQIAARASEQEAKVASLARQIEAKQAEAVENQTAMARLPASLPFLKQKRGIIDTCRRRGQTHCLRITGPAHWSCFKDRRQLDRPYERLLARDRQQLALSPDTQVRSLPPHFTGKRCFGYFCDATHRRGTADRSGGGINPRSGDRKCEAGLAKPGRRYGW